MMTNNPNPSLMGEERAREVLAGIVGGTIDAKWNRHGITSVVVAAMLAFAEEARVAEREKLLNTPETADFIAGIALEAAHQRERWAVDHDAGKSPFDWFWLIGYLAQKAASSAVAGDGAKAMHHTISTAAALGNWHAALAGLSNVMRPGIGPVNGGEKPGSAHQLATAIRKAVV